MAEATPTIRHQCRGTRRDGGACAAAGVAANGWCRMHDPERAAEVAEDRRRGGRNRADLVRLRSLVPPRLIAVYDALERALQEVHDGDLTPPQAQAMSALARALVAVLTAGELEQRVRDLEAKGAA